MTLRGLKKKKFLDPKRLTLTQILTTQTPSQKVISNSTVRLLFNNNEKEQRRGVEREKLRNTREMEEETIETKRRRKRKSWRERERERGGHRESYRSSRRLV